jgi:hypothetical protein
VKHQSCYATRLIHCGGRLTTCATGGPALVAAEVVASLSVWGVSIMAMSSARLGQQSR